MIRVRKGTRRGVSRTGWLDSRHSFSFGHYYDPEWMGFRSLRVINDDRIAGGGGFPPHPHQEMEILTWVLSGALEHQDSTGTREVLRAGELQRMTAGTGIVHSEYNHSPTEPLHLLQIWLVPATPGLTPGYEQKACPVGAGRPVRLIASPDGAEGSLRVDPDVRLLAASLGAGESAEVELAAGRHGWLQVATGVVEVNGESLEAGDAAIVEGPARVTLAAGTPAEALFFDLA